MKKGSITVFLTLILSLVLSLICTSIQSVRMEAARTQILCSMDIGLYSLFGQYDKKILDEYDLFVLNASGSDGKLAMANVYDDMEQYIKPVLKQNSQKLSLLQGGFTAYRLLTDEQGETFYQQAVQYMEDTLGSQGIQLLLKKMNERESKTQEAEKKGEQAEQGTALESYDSEMTEAAQNSQAAKEEAALEQGTAFGSGEASAEITAPAPVTNPITVIKRIMKMGILELVLPSKKGLSEAEVNRKELVSGRKLQQGISMAAPLAKDTSYTSQILFQQYLLDHLGNYQAPAGKGLKYQIEYILFGKDNDLDNLKAAANKLLLIREGVNMAAILADGVKRAQVQTLAAGIEAAFLIPPATTVIEAALMLCWAFAESVLDVRELFDGGKVSLVKTAGEWQLSLDNLQNLLDGLDSVRKGSSSGLSYEDYLQVLLLSESKNNKIMRGMDMLEWSIRDKTGNNNFGLDSCITALEAQIDVKANKLKTFTVTKQYSY